ncbi:MAG TPA: hypothetical protein VNV88_16670 [Candidatus Solibacter sp.]|nr:hypothetical protein [Candidatus Solibacter sp.]
MVSVMREPEVNSRKVLASVLLCMLALISVASPLCPACSEIAGDSTTQVALHGAQHQDNAPDCNKDTCSCCGFQFVTTSPGTVPTPIESAASLEFHEVLPPAAPVFTLYRPPRV